VAWLQPVFWVVILLGVMILIHELGHYCAALLVGVKVETFSFGFGPRLFGLKGRETDFRVSAIPFGGYVRMLGEQPGDEPSTDPRSFQAKARWQRALVVLAGPVMNIVLALAIVTGLYMSGFPKEITSGDPVITSVEPGSPAAQVGVQPGDKIVELNGRKHPTWQDVLTQEALNANHRLSVVVDRNGRKFQLAVTPRMDAKQGVGVAGWAGDVQVGEVSKGMPAQAAGLLPGDLLIRINNKPVASPATVQQAVLRSGGRPIQLMLMRDGHIQTLSITPVPTSNNKMPWRIGIGFRMPVEMVKLGLGPAFNESVRLNLQNATLIFQVLGSIVERRVSPKTLAGPIGIAQMSSEAAHEGVSSFFGWMALVSLNLAIFNLLPIPILDGGTLLMLIVEMLMQREMSMQVKETVFKLGFVFLMMIVVFVIYNDISRILTNS
jgi:regulator of sigma E protease